MKTLKERIGELSQYLQYLMKPSVFPEVQDAVKHKDQSKLIEVFRKAKIPEIYIGVLAPLLLQANPEQIKWPAIY